MAGKTYVRPVTGDWWTKKPFYRWYMLREATSFLVAAYAVVLLFGLWRLSQGQAAFEAWRAWLSTPPALVFHAVALVAFLYHGWTWFEVMPKTMPFVRVGGKRVSDRAIVASGATAAVVASILLFAVVRGLAS